MLVTNDASISAKVQKWASQSREDKPWYEHSEIGYNYRLSNVLAALGRSQFRRVDTEVLHRRAVREQYRDRLARRDGIRVQDDPPWGRSNAWLPVICIDQEMHPDGSRRLRESLDAEGIESRPMWKPMHLQPVFQDCPTFLNGQAEKLFEEGLCLPSGPNVTLLDVHRVCDVVESTLF